MRASRSSLLRAGQALLFACAAFLALRALHGQWDALRSDAALLRPHWGGIALSTLPVLASYALLIDAWRTTVGAWGTRLAYASAARIWTVSNLGKYVPGKVWAFGAVAMLTVQAGGSGTAAAAGAVIVQLITIASGFGVAALFGSRALDALAPALPPGATTVLATVGVLALALLPILLPHAATLAGRLLKREVRPPPLPARLVWRSAAASAVAWVLFGVGFHALASALGVQAATLPEMIAAFTASYLVGFLAIFAPGGLFVRELTLQAALVAVGVPPGRATLLAVTSRLWLTVLEVLPALLFLVAGPGRRRRDAATG